MSSDIREANPSEIGGLLETFSGPSFYMQIFCIICGDFGHVFWKNLQQIFLKQGGGGQMQFGKSPKIHPFLWGVGFLKSELRYH